MKMQLIETERLILRALTPEVYEFVFQTYSKEELIHFFGCTKEEDLAEERKKYDEGLSMYRKSTFIFQLIKKSTNSVIGWCGYHTWYLQHHRAEIGYVMNEDNRGKGYMKEALPVIIGYGFEVLRLQRIEALIAPDNKVSLKLVQSLGFKQEGRLREHYLVNEQFEDSLIFSLLVKEYKNADVNTAVAV